MSADTGPAFERGAWTGRGALSLFVVAQVAFIVVGALVAVIVNDGGRWAEIAHFMAAYRPLRTGGYALSPIAVFLSVLARTTATLSLVLGFRRWLSRSASPASFGFVRPTIGMVSLGLLVGIVLIVIDALVANFQGKLFGSHPSQWTTIMASHRGSAAYILDVSAGALISPVAEELIFRGLLFAALVQRTPVWVAVILSSALFAAAHYQPYTFAAIFVVGVGQTLLYYRTRNIWVAISAHVLVNFVSLSLHFLVRP